MARLFEQVEPVPEPPKKKFKIKPFLLLLLAWIVSCSIIFMFMERKKEREIENKNMGNLVELLNMDNGSVLTQKVKYETFQKTDPEDTSEIFFEVVNPGESGYEVGDLLKYNHRFFKEQGIEGKKYCVIEKSQVDFHLKKKDVKESLLKRPQ